MYNRLDVARKHEHIVKPLNLAVLILSYWHSVHAQVCKTAAQFITVSGVLIPVIHHFHNITIHEGSSSGKHTVLVPSLLTNLLILSYHLKLLVSIAKLKVYIP